MTIPGTRLPSLKLVRSANVRTRARSPPATGPGMPTSPARRARSATFRLTSPCRTSTRLSRRTTLAPATGLAWTGPPTTRSSRSALDAYVSGGVDYYYGLVRDVSRRCHRSMPWRPAGRQHPGQRVHGQRDLLPQPQRHDVLGAGFRPPGGRHSGYPARTSRPKSSPSLQSRAGERWHAMVLAAARVPTARSTAGNATVTSRNGPTRASRHADRCGPGLRHQDGKRERSHPVHA